MLRRYGGNAGGCAPPHPRELARKGNTPRVAVADDVKACVKGVRRGDQAAEPRTAYCILYVLRKAGTCAMRVGVYWPRAGFLGPLA